MKFQEKKALKEKIYNLILKGLSQKDLKVKLEAEGYKSYSVDSQLINAKIDLYSNFSKELETNDRTSLKHLDSKIVDDLFSKYEEDKTNVKQQHIKALGLKGKSLEEINEQLKGKDYSTELIENTYRKVLDENENLDPKILKENLSRANFGLICSVLYVLLKVVQIGLQLVKDRVSVITLFTLIIGIVGIIYFVNKKNKLNEQRTV